MIKNEIDIGIITIAYDGYGRFLMDWFGSIYRQTKRPKEVVVVLSNRHNFSKKDRDVIVKMGEMLKIEVKIIEEKERKSIGELRNIGIKEMKTDWILYFSADDVLMENAIEEIDRARAAIRSGSVIKEEVDVVALRYYQECYYERVKKETPLPERRKMKDWRKYYYNSGYIAFKRNAWEESKYEKNDYPNFPFIFQLVYLGKRFSRTEKECAVYIKRADSHSGKRTQKQNERAYQTIDEAAKKYGL